MKKLVFIITVIALSCYLLSCCHKGTYDDGFADGYSEGRWDALIEHEDDYSRGYDDGYSEGFWVGSKDRGNNGQEILDAAEDYAMDQTGWSVYEAWNSISIYHDGVDPDGFPIPTKEEYRQCVDTLVLFCEYLEGELP